MTYKSCLANCLAYSPCVCIIYEHVSMCVYFVHMCLFCVSVCVCVCVHVFVLYECVCVVACVLPSTVYSVWEVRAAKLTKQIAGVVKNL